MIKISEFSSLYFSGDWKLDFQQDVCYMPSFLPSDKIQIQYILTEFSILPYIIYESGEMESLSPELIYDNGESKCYNLTIKHEDVTEETLFTLVFKDGDDVILSSSYKICPGLDGTILLEYTNRRNAMDTIFSGVGRFTFRVEGAFLPQEVQFSNDTEDFRDQRFVPKVLSSMAYEQKKLTLGGGFGVPNWVARKINLIFALSSVHVNGTPMMRSDGSSVEITVIGTYYPLYLYKILLEECSDESDGNGLIEYLRSIDEKKKLIRSVSEDELRVYIDSLGVDSAKMIRELDLITDLFESYIIEIDDKVSTSSKKTTLGAIIEFLKSYLVSYTKWDEYIDQPIKKSDSPTFENVVANSIESPDFQSGFLGSGFQLKDGKLIIDKLLVRKEATFIEAVVEKMRFTGGVYVLSSATGFKIAEVEIKDDVYRCYFSTSTDYKNEFVVGDQARIQDYITGKYLWSLVTNVGEHYIDISRTDCDGNGIPEEGDEIVQLGNRTDPGRQDAVLLSAIDGEVGIITYFGIDSFSLDGREGSWIGKHGGKKGAVIRGEFYFESGESVKDAISAMNDSSSFKETIVDLTELDVNTYYPVVFPVNTEPRVNYQVYHRWDDGVVPWSNHWFMNILLDCQWSDIGGSSDYHKNIIVNTFECEFTKNEISPIGKIGKLTKVTSVGKSMEYCYLRGGTIYRCRIPSIIDGIPILYPDGYTQEDELLLPIYDLTDLLTADPVDVVAIESIIPKPIVQLHEIESEVQFTKDRLLLLASESMYEGATKETPLLSVLSSRIDVNADGITILSESLTNTNKRIEDIDGNISSIEADFNKLSDDLSALDEDFQEVKVAGIVTNENFVTIFAGKANSLGESMVAAINVTPNGVVIKGSKISLNGAVSVNSTSGETTVSINNETGILIARGAEISGKITSIEGVIGGFTISENAISNGGLTLTTDVLTYVGNSEEIYIGSEYYKNESAAYSIYVENRKPSTSNTIQYCAGFSDGYNSVLIGSLSNGFGIKVDGSAELNGAIHGRVVTKSGSINNEDFILLVSSSNSVSMSLPNTAVSGRIIMIRKVGSGNVTVTGNIMNAWNSTVSSVTIDNGDLGVFIYSGTYWISNSINNF